jgi:hypothetical protein
MEMWTRMKTRTRIHVLLALQALGCLALAAPACSSKDDGIKCGDGTVLKDGVCVALAPPPSSALPPPLPSACIEYQAYVSKCPKATDNDKATLKRGLEEMQKMLASKSPTERDQALVEIGRNCRTGMDAVRPICEPGAGGVASAPPGPTEVAKLKDTVKFERAEWVVLAASDQGRHLASNNQFQKPLSADDGKFILVRFKIKNLTNTKARTKPPKLKDGHGRVFEPLLEAPFYVPEDSATLGVMHPIPPGIATEYWEPYQVADDSTELVLLTHELDDESNTKPVALGI